MLDEIKRLMAQPYGKGALSDQHVAWLIQAAEGWQEWNQKTEWVQDAEWSGKYLGMHRADAMRARLAEIERQDPRSVVPVAVALKAVSYVGSANYESREREATGWIHTATFDGYAAPVSPAAQAVLDKPARVGNTIFREGVRASLVIGRAQREYEYRASDPATLPPDVDQGQFDYVSPRAAGELANTTGIPAELCRQIGAAFWRRAMPGVPPPDDETMVHAVGTSLMLLGDRLAANVAQAGVQEIFPGTSEALNNISVFPSEGQS